MNHVDCVVAPSMSARLLDLTTARVTDVFGTYESNLTILTAALRVDFQCFKAELLHLMFLGVIA